MSKTTKATVLVIPGMMAANADPASSHLADAAITESGSRNKRNCRQTGAADCITWREIDPQRAPLPKRQADVATDVMIVPGPIACPYKGTGHIRVSREPLIWAFCQEARGRVSPHPRGRRHLHPDPNYEQLDEAQNRMSEVRL